MNRELSDLIVKVAVSRGVSTTLLRRQLKKANPDGRTRLRALWRREVGPSFLDRVTAAGKKTLTRSKS